MKIVRLVGGSYEENGYIIYDEKEGIIIDPGYNPKDFLNKIKELKLEIKGIYLTHHHYDHIGAVDEIVKELGCTVYIHRLDGDMYKGNATYLESEDRFYVGENQFKVIHTPGHTKGSVCFMCRNQKQAFTGDTIFNVDLGRTDLQDGNEKEMENSIVNIISLWSNEIFIHPGHGDGCTMKKVRKINQEYLDIMDRQEKREIKLIALDLDGTTLNKKGQVSQRTKETLRKAMNVGVHVVIATGRCYSAIPEDVKHLEGIEYLVTSNGGLTKEVATEKTIGKNCIEVEAMDRVLETLKNIPHMIEVFVDGRAYMDKKIYDAVINGEIKYRHSDYIIKTREPKENLLGFAEERKSDIENINIFYANQEDRHAEKPILDAIPNVTITTSLENNWEIGGKNTSKAEALKVLMNDLGIKKEEMMACGDNSNDCEMLKLAEIKVAMDNGNADVRKVAKYIVSSNEFDGVAEAVERFVL